MRPPREVLAECPSCERETAHEVLGGRVEGKRRIVLRSSVRCAECGHVHSVELTEERPIDVPIIVSWMEQSDRRTISLLPDDELKVGDELYLDGARLLITSLESAGRRGSSGRAREIDSIWAKRFDKVRIRISLDYHGKVVSKEIEVVPEEEFCPGEMMEIDGRDAVITSIRTGSRTIRRGGARAAEIVRIYAKGIRKKTSH